MFRGVESVITLRKENMFLHTNAFRVTPSQKRCPRWRANRTGDIKASKLSTFVSKLVNVGRLDFFGSETSKVVVALIVGENDNEVWFCLIFRRYRRNSA